MYIYTHIHISTMDKDLKGKIKTIKVLEEIQENMFMA